MHKSLAISIVLVAAVLAAAPAWAQAQRIPPVPMGELFPPRAFKNFNTATGGPPTIDLGASLGQRPIVMLYWVPEHPRADAALQQLQKLVDEYGDDRLAAFAVSVPRPGREEPQIVKRLAELEIRLPVLDDSSFVLGQMLRVQTVPNVTLIDKSGRLRLTNGASLAQVIGYNQTIESAIRRAAETGEVGTHGFLAQYYPVKEMVGQKCPDFKAPLLSNSVEQRWSSMIKKDHLNVLIFWSVDCPHCRKSLPEINTWLRQNADGINVISAASVTDDEMKAKTKQFCDLNRFVFPTLVDHESRIGQLYNITSTPTILFIGPDGVIDSVMTSGNMDFGTTASKKKRELIDG